MRKYYLAFIAAALLLGSTLVTAAPTLDIGLLIDGAGDLVSYAGWPLLFEVCFGNQGALNDTFYNQQIEAELAKLTELVAAGEITEAQADQVRTTLVLREIEPIVFGAEELPWTELVTFESSSKELPWSISILAEEIPANITLDAVGVAVAWYGLDAGDSIDVAPGVYEVSIVVSTEGINRVPEDMWTGTSASTPVRLEIQIEPYLTDELLVQKWIVFGRYEFYRGAFANAEAYLLDAVALDPIVVEAWVLLGDAQYAQGKLEKALDSFYTAFDILTAQPGNELAAHVEPPTYIILRIAQIQDALDAPVTAEEP